MLNPSMNQQIRETVKLELMRQKKTQGELAGRIEVSQQYVSKILRGHTDGSIDVWQKIFDELGLELIVKRKGQE
jgi:transcriptional regulator with XRE-family HTH domain